MTGTATDTGTCGECGFDYERFAVPEAPAAIRVFGRRYRAPLTRFLPGEDGEGLLRTRPEPATWSALEYAAHVADVFGMYERWIGRQLLEDRPVFDDLSPDDAAVERRYNEKDPLAVVDDLGANAERLAATVEAVPPESWDRVGIRWGQERSVAFTARRAVHEGNHHLLDIGRGLRTLRDRAKA